MKTIRYWRSALLLLLALSAGALAAQEAGGTEGSKAEVVIPPRKLLVFYRGESKTLTEGENILLREALLVSLQGVREDCFAIEADPLAGPDSDDEKSSLARRRACDGWFFARVSDSGEGLRVDYALYDSVNLVFTAKTSFEARKPDARDLSRVFWRDAAAAVGELPPLDPLPSFVVRGTPGTRVFGLGRRGIRLDAEGTGTVTVPVPGIYSLRAEKSGYDPVAKQVLLKESSGEIILDQKRGSLFSVDFSMLNAQFPGVDLTVFAVPNAVFFKAGFTSFLKGFGGVLTADDEEDEAVDLTVSHPMMHLVLQAGFYAGQADKLLRFYFGAGALARLFFADSGTVLEPVIPYGFFPVFGMEFSTNPKSRFYLEATPTAYYVAENNYIPGMDFREFVEDYLYSGGSLGIELFGRWYVDLMVFRVGYRRHL